MTARNWVRLSTQWWSDDLELTMSARGLFSVMLSYCGDLLTDGHISPRALARIVSGECDADVTRNVEMLRYAGLLNDGPNGALEVANWDRWQATKSDVNAKRDASVKRQQAYRDRKNGGNTPTGDANVTRNADQPRYAPVTRPDTDTDTDTEEKRTTSSPKAPKPSATPTTDRHRDAIVAVFEAWQETQPRPGSCVLTAARKKAIRARLADGYDEATLVDAARGWQHDPWPGRDQHKALEVLMRSDNVEKMAELWRNGPGATAIDGARQRAADDLTLARQVAETMQHADPFGQPKAIGQ